MDPVQRIPRYTLMFRGKSAISFFPILSSVDISRHVAMIKHMPDSDPQRQKLIEADEVASKIALCETDDQTKRATIMYCLERSIEGFPANLISNTRRFIDCIDVEDLPADGPANGYGNTPEPGVVNTPLHCTLILFDDRLLIVKRPSAGSSGRSLSGLDEVNKVARLGGLPSGVKKGILSCKGVLDVTEIVATDVGGAGIWSYSPSA